MDRKPEGGAEETSFGALIRPASVSPTSAVRGVERSRWGVVAGRAGRLADVRFPPAGSAEQFMNDSPHCQADSLLSWGLGGRGGGCSSPLRTTRAAARTCTRTRARTRAHARESAGPLTCWGQYPTDGFPGQEGGAGTPLGLWRTSLRFLSSLPLAVYIQIN